MIEKRLGKIQKVYCGYGGYQDNQLGISFTLGGEGWGVGTPHYGAWGTKRTDSTQWTEKDRIQALGETFMKIKGWLDDAKVRNVYELEGQPVEVTFEGMVLTDWRILKEVL